MRSTSKSRKEVLDLVQTVWSLISDAHTPKAEELNKAVRGIHGIMADDERWSIADDDGLPEPAGPDIFDAIDDFLDSSDAADTARDIDEQQRVIAEKAGETKSHDDDDDEDTPNGY